ncbi:MAG: hypothetical protein M1281_03290 [Chloroflexi bacterium]|nr:hypothetical protein [Chloroflexota bacterium]
MKPLKLALRIWIALVAAIGFLAGWVTLAHAGKPAPLMGSQSTTSNLAALPTLAPIPQFGSSSSSGLSGLQPIPSAPQSPAFSIPQIRTGGS